MGFRYLLILSGVVTLGAVTVPAAAAPTRPWAPAPVNSCGETGFDPVARQPDPAAPQ
ncbi:carbohydrate-binding protein, partial [Nocardia seriolae]|nr:carbohydrate-binding protein [Nocardia seriolae]